MLSMNRIRELGKNCDWTQEVIGNKLNVQKAAISKCELELVPLTELLTIL